jgi:hypothetical protein
MPLHISLEPRHWKFLRPKTTADWFWSVIFLQTYIISTRRPGLLCLYYWSWGPHTTPQCALLSSQPSLVSVPLLMFNFYITRFFTRPPGSLTTVWLYNYEQIVFKGNKPQWRKLNWIVYNFCFSNLILWNETISFMCLLATSSVETKTPISIKFSTADIELNFQIMFI